MTKALKKSQYELIAGAVARTRIVATLDKNSVRRYAKGEALALLITDLAATLKHNDPKFDEDKFKKACGVEHEHQWQHYDGLLGYESRTCRVCGVDENDLR